MLNELLQIAKKCDREQKWTKEQWENVLTNCVLKNQYILKIKNKEIIGFACWLFVKEKKSDDGQFIEDNNGEIAYIQCAYSKEKGLLSKMLTEGLLRYSNKDFKKLYWYNEKDKKGKYFEIRK